LRSSIIGSAGGVSTRVTLVAGRSPDRVPRPSRDGRAGGLPADALADSARSLSIELVLTAHPTEIVRRALLQAHRRIADLLAVRDRPDLTPDESDAHSGRCAVKS